MGYRLKALLTLQSLTEALIYLCLAPFRRRVPRISCIMQCILRPMFFLIDIINRVLVLNFPTCFPFDILRVLRLLESRGRAGKVVMPAPHLGPAQQRVEQHERMVMCGGDVDRPAEQFLGVGVPPLVGERPGQMDQRLTMQQRVVAARGDIDRGAVVADRGRQAVLPAHPTQQRQPVHLSPRVPLGGGTRPAPARPARAAGPVETPSWATQHHAESPLRFRRAGWRYPSRRTLA